MGIHVLQATNDHISCFCIFLTLRSSLFLLLNKGLFRPLLRSLDCLVHSTFETVDNMSPDVNELINI